MREVLSDQRLRPHHPCLVETLEVTGKGAPASVELYALGRQAKFHVIVQQLCEVTPRPPSSITARVPSQAWSAPDGVPEDQPRASRHWLCGGRWATSSL
jgi:hypothetical protein